MPDEMFNEAVQALKAGQRQRAKDLFTRLIRVDQANPDYWLWMSAAVDTEKEQIFCLQNVLKRDPNSIPARRGLVLLGALSPAEAGLPPADVLEHTRAVIPDLASGPGGLLGRRRNRELLAVGAVGAIATVVLVVACLAVFAPGLFRPQRVVVVTSTPTPSRPAPAATATFFETPLGGCEAPADPDPATPLAAYLCLDQTPTPLPFATESSISEDYNSVKAAYAAADWSKIIGRASALLADPALSQNARVHFYLAEAYRHTGNLAEALGGYRTAAQIDATFAPAYWGKARVEIEQNKRNDALADFDRAITADPGFVPAYLDRATYQALAGDPASALADLEQAWSIAPDNAFVMAQLAMAHLDAGNLARAQSLTDVALQADPGLAAGYFARGRLGMAQDDFVAAESDLSRSYRYLLALDVPMPSQAQAIILYQTGLGKAGVGDDRSAISLFTQGLALDNSRYTLYLARGEANMRLDILDAAQADLTTAINQLERGDPTNPDLAEAQTDLGQILLSLNKTTEAASAFQAALRVVPEHFEANFGLGQAYLLLGRVDDAIASFTAAISAAQDDETAYQSLLWRARAFEAAGRPQEEALDLLAARALGISAGTAAPTIAARLTVIGPLPTATPEPTSTPTLGTPPSPTSSPTRTVRPSATATSSPTATVTRTPTPSSTPSPTRTGTPTQTPSPTRTPTPTRTRTPTP
jgi:tetratricopeptide (TPR) repeat protein